MAEIETLDLKTFVIDAIKKVFDTMLFLEIEISGTDSEVSLDNDRIVGSVSFAGEVMGNICIHVGDTLARLMTGSMLGMELEEIEGEEEVHDVIGEFSNMIGGDLKSHLSDCGMPCELSVPSITSGTDFKVESIGWSRHERLAFRHKQHIALVELFMK
jgi:CheY-specific phosphatase CheX